MLLPADVDARIRLGLHSDYARDASRLRQPFHHDSHLLESAQKSRQLRQSCFDWPIVRPYSWLLCFYQHPQADRHVYIFAVPLQM